MNSVEKKVKESRYNNIVDIDDELFLYNSLSNAIIRLSTEKKKILETNLKTEIILTETQKKLFQMGFLVPVDLEEINIVENQFQKNKFTNSKLMLSLFPTYLCNLSCDYCFVRKKINKKIITNNIISTYFNTILSLMKKEDPKYFKIQILGGEPLLILDEIIEFAQKVNNEFDDTAQLHIVSNGSIKLTEEQITRILNSNIKSIQFSIDGLEKEHDSIKKMKGTYNRLFNNINNIVKYSKLLEENINIILRINISVENSKSLNELFLDLVNRINDISKIGIYPAFIDNINQNTSDTHCVINSDQVDIIEQFYILCKKYAISYSYRINSLLGNCMFLNDSSYCIDPDFKIFKCENDMESDKFSIGKVVKNKIILNNYDNYGRLRHLNIFSESYLNKKECNNCSWLPICRGDCPLVEKNKNCKLLMIKKVRSFIKYGQKMK